MKATSVSALALAAVLQATLAVAQTSLYVPGFDPQAITVDVEGVDAQGRTTYRIGPGASSGTFDDLGGLIGSATLVADATEAHIVYANTAISPFSISEDCVVANGQAVCSGVVSAEGTLQTLLVTETAAPFAVQGGAAATGAAGSGSDSGSAGSATPTAGSGVSSGVSQTSSATPGTTTSGGNNGVGKTGASIAVSFGVAGLVSAFFL